MSVSPIVCTHMCVPVHALQLGMFVVVACPCTSLAGEGAPERCVCTGLARMCGCDAHAEPLVKGSAGCATLEMCLWCVIVLHVSHPVCDGDGSRGVCCPCGDVGW